MAMAPAEPARLPWQGLAAGGLAVACWAAYLALARAGIAGSGLHASDIAVLRFGPAGLLLLPVLLRVGMGGLSWPRAVALAALAGTPFILLGAGGYAFAPLAHGAVLQPAAVTLGSAALAWAVLGAAPGRGQFLGLPLMLGGLVLVAGIGAAMPGAWRGDIMFVAAGLLWASFAVLLKRWRVDAWRATAVVAVLSAAVTLPAFAVLEGFDRLAALPTHTLVLQILVQGVLSGIVAVWGFGRAVALLGPARAGLFPGLVPVATVLLGIPLTGEFPAPLQVLGLALATIGLVLAVRR